MPPKSSSKQQQQPKIARPTKHEVEAVQRYLAQKPDFEKLIEEAKQSPKSSPAAKREETEYERKTREAVSALHKGKANASVTMPVHPKEEETSGNLTDQVAKESSDSTASSHPHHSTEDAGKATIDDHKANPGPVISESLGQQPVASKEESRKKAEEMNK